MKIIIFGATGTIGTQLVEQALAQGHQVTAVTRNPAGYTIKHNNLRAHEADIFDEASVGSVISGHDAVICAIGSSLTAKGNPRALGTKNIVAAMKRTGVKRLVSLSAYGVSDSRAQLPPLYRYFIIPVILGRVFADHAVQESHIKPSSLDWVIVRPANFVKTSLSGPYKHGFTKADPSLTLKIMPSEVASFMLQQLSDDTYLRQTPAISH